MERLFVMTFRYLSQRTRGLILSAILLWGATCSSAEVHKFVRFAHGGQTVYGLLEGEKVEILSGTPFGEWAKTGESVQYDGIKPLPVSEPTKVFGVASNYHPEGQPPKEKPAEPQLFFKLPSATIGQGYPIVIPRDATSVIYEGEMVAVIGKVAKNVSVEEAPDYVLGVACGNDVSGAGWENDTEWWRRKATDTFAPVGPLLVTGLDYTDLPIEFRVNGEVKQKSRTSKMVHNTAEVVSFISQYITLEPGDLIYTGTPGPIGLLEEGDVAEVEIEGLGVLRNPTVQAK
jgi:2-keto-4-pentenoate hydratase/2-oxohepta-3-ene-1,7-dioic acid hydratase in catechol pathway